MNKEEIIEMLHDIAKTISGFDGTVKGLLKINDYIMKLKENTTTDGSDELKVCSDCGVQAERKGAKFCYNCGTKFE